MDWFGGHWSPEPAPVVPDYTEERAAAWERFCNPEPLTPEAAQYAADAESGDEVPEVPNPDEDRPQLDPIEAGRRAWCRGRFGRVGQFVSASTSGDRQVWVWWFHADGGPDWQADDVELREV